MLNNQDTSVCNKIDDFFKKGVDNVYTLNNVVIRQEFGDSILLPAHSVFRDRYRDILFSNAIELPLNEDLVKKYRYNPKRLAYDLYGTTDLWHIIMVINNLTSVTQFTLDGELIYIYDPNKKSDLNRILYKDQQSVK